MTTRRFLGATLMIVTLVALLWLSRGPYPAIAQPAPAGRCCPANPPPCTLVAPQFPGTPCTCPDGRGGLACY